MIEEIAYREYLYNKNRAMQIPEGFAEGHRDCKYLTKPSIEKIVYRFSRHFLCEIENVK